MDWDHFVQRSRALAPEKKLGPTLCLTGILDHRKSMYDELKQSDFCWMKCDEMTKGQRIRELYQKHYAMQCVQLYSKAQLVSDDDLVKGFAKSEDGFTTFIALDPVQAKMQPSSSGLLLRKQPDAEVTQKQGHDNDVIPSTEPHNCSAITVLNAQQAHVKEERSSLPIPTYLPLHDSIVGVATTFDFNSIAEPTAEKSFEEDLVPPDRKIRRVIDLEDPDTLEAGVAQSMQILKNLKQIFSHHIELKMDAEAAAWIETIEKLTSQAERKRTVIGVVGNTGAGKSSVINAMLDEERLVPTNCMRACTSVVTEISWNNNASASKYRADVEFIGQEDWQKELAVLMQEFLSGNGTLLREAYDLNSEAGIAWEKFRAVYPSVPRDELHEGIIPTLMSEPSVSSVLGTIKQISMDRPESFYLALQKYVDSKEKLSNGKDQGKGKGRKPRRELEYWPLIKVVKIYTTSSALSTGAVIVDLPGVHDSNAARAAVAQGYMKQCTGLWIVAPINRAVDDKAAKTLLGDSFKRQLKYDGGFSTVTFICSKTDDISITEAIGSLELEAEIAELDKQERSGDEKIEQVMSMITQLKESQVVRKVIITETSSNIETWESLQEQLEGGGLVYAPVTRPKKRKKASTNDESQKRRQATVGDSDEDDFFRTTEQSPSSDDEAQCQAERVRLTELDIKKKLKELKDSRKSAQMEGTEVQNTIIQLKEQVRQLESEKSSIRAEVSRICIAERNLYSKSAIQQDFAAGIKELDQASAAEFNEETFDPEEEIRDYEQVARSLPVFCVSSRAYQKMCGRMQKDDDVPGFVAAEDTEIPQLQNHCRKLTESGRCQTSRTFLTNFSQLLITLKLWTLGKSPNLKLAGKDKQHLIEFLNQKLMELRTSFGEITLAFVEEIRSEMNLRVCKKFSGFINCAIVTAPERAGIWGQSDQGGLMFASYKAVVRRDGVFHSTAAGHRDFNSDLVEPITKPLAPIWERTFQVYLPGVISKYVEQLSKLPRKFHEAVEAHAQSTGIESTALFLLSTKVPNYELIFKNLDDRLNTEMNKFQRDANRDFAPSVAEIMRVGYTACAKEHGPGSFKRMKQLMAGHIELVRRKMFHKAVAKVCERLRAMCKALQKLMEDELTHIADQIDTDYTGTLCGKSLDQLVGPQTNEDAELKSAVLRVLKSIDVQFEPIANGDISLVDEATQIDITVEIPDHDDKDKHHNINGLAQESPDEAGHKNNHSDSFKLSDLSPRLHRSTARYQAYVENELSDSE